VKHIFGWIGFGITVPWNISLAKNSPNRTELKGKNVCMSRENKLLLPFFFLLFGIKNFQFFCDIRKIFLSILLDLFFIYLRIVREENEKLLDIRLNWGRCGRKQNFILSYHKKFVSYATLQQLFQVILSFTYAWFLKSQ